MNPVSQMPLKENAGRNDLEDCDRREAPAGSGIGSHSLWLAAKFLAGDR